MSLKNINEIQTNDYRAYDQSFLKETLDALANSGQRFGSPGAGVTISYFKTSDCFNTQLKENSYVQCKAFVSNTDIQSYRDMYGDIMHYSNAGNASAVDLTYLRYYTSYKTGGGDWVTSVLGTVRLDAPAGVLTSVNDNKVLPLNTVSIEKTENRETVNSYTHVICAYYNSIYYTGYDGTPRPLEYSSAFDINCYTDYYNSIGNQFAYIYLRYNVPADGARYTYTDTEAIKSIHVGLANLSYFTDWQGRIFSYFENTISSYRYYILTYFSADSKNTVIPSSDDVKNTVSNAFDYYKGINLVGNIFSSNFRTPSDYYNNAAIIIRNSRNSSNVEYLYYSYTKTASVTDVLPGNMGTLLAPAKSIISDIISSGVSEAQKTVSDYYKENIRKTFLNTLMWKTAYDYVSEYISDKLVTSLDDYTEVNTYLNKDMRINVYASSLDSSVLYGTSGSVHGEYCTNADVSKTVSKKILGGGNKYNQFVSDWSKINAGKYDEDCQMFDVYDRNVLFDIKADYTSDGTLSDLIETGNVYVSGKYTLPFINTDKYWCINGEQTPIRAVGLDADQPSIIILSSEDGKTAEVKSTLHKNDIVNYIKFYSAAVNIDGTSDAKGYGISTPVIDVAAIKSSDDTSADILKFVKSALIMSIVKSSGEIEVAVKDGYVTTFWTYNEELDMFTAITNAHGNAFDLSTLASVSGIINAGFNSFIEEPGKYKHDQLILSSDLYLFKDEVLMQNSDGSVTTELIGAIQNFGNDIMNTAENADEYGVIPYSNADENISTGITTVIGLFDKSEREKSSKYVNKSVKYSYDSNLAIKFNGYGKVDNTVKQMRYDDLNYKSETRDYFVETKDYVPASSSRGFAYQPSMLDVSSMFINHANALNRINILTLGEQTTAGAPFYYSYIGTSYDNTQKANLVIGTSTRNVDVSRHIIHVKDNNNFSKNTSIDINFDKINLNGDTNVNVGIIWHKMGTSSYYYTHIVADTDIIRPVPSTASVAKTPYMDEVTSTSYTIDVMQVLKTQYKQSVTSDGSTFYIPVLDYYNGTDYIAANKFQDILCVAELTDADKKEYKLKYAMPIQGSNSVSR